MYIRCKPARTSNALYTGLTNGAQQPQGCPRVPGDIGITLGVEGANGRWRGVHDGHLQSGAPAGAHGGGPSGTIYPTLDLRHVHGCMRVCQGAPTACAMLRTNRIAHLVLVNDGPAAACIRPGRDTLKEDLSGAQQHRSIGHVRVTCTAYTMEILNCRVGGGASGNS